MSAQPDHELEVLEDDQTVPPRPEEAIADAPTAQATAEVGTGAGSDETG